MQETFIGNTTGMGDNFHAAGIISGCPGEDYVLGIQLEEGNALDVYVTPSTSTYDVALIISENYICSNTQHMGYLVVKNLKGPGLKEEIINFVAPADGVFYIVVDSKYAPSNAAGHGAFTLLVSDHQPRAGEECNSFYCYDSECVDYDTCVAN